MPIDKENFNKKLYDLLKTKRFKPVPKDSKNQRTESPQEADVFNFTFTKAGEDLGDAWVTIDDAQDVILYYDDSLMDTGGRSETSEYDDSFTGFIKHLKRWAMSKQLGFELRDKNKLGDDMAQREYTRKKENISEGYYPMGKQSSYNDNIPTVKIILQHTRTIQEGEQRYRNIARIFLENQHGERFLAPTVRPGIAQVYARHIAEGGLPNDDRWNHIKGLCEEYTKMAGFVRATRNKQFNESAQSLINEGVNHYYNLRETLGKMRGTRGYHKYFESYTPTLMETEGEEDNLNELFVRETLDPRIESVMPILKRLSKTISEMSEVKELDEWAGSLTEVEKSDDKVGEDEVKELMLYAENNKDLYRQRFIPIVKNLEKKFKKGTYDKTLAAKLWKYFADDAAKRYGQEHGNGDGLKIFNPMVRRKVAAMMAANHFAEMEAGNFHDMPFSGGKPAQDVAKDEFGNVIKPENRAKHLAKLGRNSVNELKEPDSITMDEYLALRKKIQNTQVNPKLDKLPPEKKEMILKDIAKKLATLKLKAEKSGLEVNESEESVAEDLGPEQKRVGQLGPTEKVKNANIGKLVGGS